LNRPQEVNPSRAYSSTRPRPDRTFQAAVAVERGLVLRRAANPLRQVRIGVVDVIGGAYWASGVLLSRGSTSESDYLAEVSFIPRVV
jgi:hypothetical protein